MVLYSRTEMLRKHISVCTRVICYYQYRFKEPMIRISYISLEAVFTYIYRSVVYAVTNIMFLDILHKSALRCCFSGVSVSSVTVSSNTGTKVALNFQRCYYHNLCRNLTKVDKWSPRFSGACFKFDDNQKRRGGTMAKIVEHTGPLKPYLKLMRLHKPTGVWFLFWPASWGIAAAAPAGSSPDFHCMLMFFAMCAIMRGAGCTINDMWDKNIDSKVSRTKDRPLAQNELTRFDALVFLGAQLGLGCLILLQYNFYTILLSASSLSLAITYPLMKKIIPWPQLVLGMAMNWCALLGSPAVNGYSDWATCLPLYVGGICWTIVYDTIYAFQDMKEDKELGLKSTAISFSESPRIWLSGFSTAMISSFATCGVLSNQTWPFYCSLCAISAILSHQIYTLDIDNKEDCSKKFMANQWIGLILLLGIVTGNLLKNEKSLSQQQQQRDAKENASRNFLVSDNRAVRPL